MYPIHLLLFTLFKMHKTSKLTDDAYKKQSKNTQFGKIGPLFR